LDSDQTEAQKMGNTRARLKPGARREQRQGAGSSVSEASAVAVSKDGGRARIRFPRSSRSGVHSKRARAFYVPTNAGLDQRDQD
jgi:hypothetical protein